jgi:hypothetical protein
MAFSVWGRGSAGVAEAIRYAADKGVRIANGSFGIPAAQVIEDALAASPDLLLTVSAGNQAWNVEENKDARYPCVSEQPNVVCVAATDREDRLAGFSNWGTDSVDLAAPGVDLISVGLPPYIKLYDYFFTPLDARWETGGTGGAWQTGITDGEWGANQTTGLHESPGGPHANDADTWIQNAQPFDMSLDSACSVFTSLFTDLGAGDELRVEASADGVPWTLLHTYTGTTPPRGASDSRHVDLAPVEGRTGVRVRLRLVSDGAVQGPGRPGRLLPGLVPPGRVPRHRVPLGRRHVERRAPGRRDRRAPARSGTPELKAPQLRAKLLESVEPLPGLTGRTVTGGASTPSAPWACRPRPRRPRARAAHTARGGAARGAPTVAPRPAADRRAPRCTARPARARRGVLRVTARCDEAGRLTARLSSGRATIAKAAATVPPPGHAQPHPPPLPRLGGPRAPSRPCARDAAPDRRRRRRQPPHDAGTVTLR